jgi:phage tail sheath protein FI
MPANFLHGVEVFEYTSGPAPINVVKSAVIGLVGSAPLFAVGATPPAFRASNNSTAVIVGTLMIDPNGNIQVAAVGGTTAAAAPTFMPQVGALTVDGTVTWRLVQIGQAGYLMQLWDPSWLIVAGQQCIDGNGNIQTATTGGTTGTATPTWATVLNATTTDNGVTWKLTQLGPIPNLQTPVLISGGNLNANVAGQAGVFGPLIQGYTIPYALGAVFGQGAGQAIVVNVFDLTLHNSSMTAQAFTFPASGAQVINLGHMGVGNVKVTNTGATTTYVQGTDFTVDHVNGVVAAKSGGAITTGMGVKVTCVYADPSKVADAVLVGAVTSGVYTGMQNWLRSYGLFGFFPKLLIAPSFGASTGFQSAGSQDAIVASALTTMAGTIRGICYVDCPPGTPVATLLSNRGASGNAFNTSSTRVVPCGPQEQFSDLGIVPTGITLSAGGAPIQNPFNATNIGPYSPFAAGAQAAKDLQKGYWWSASNTPINGLLGPDVAVYSSILDAASDVNNLNAAGIQTIFNTFGTGLRVWGNRSAGYPTITTPDNFISVRRTMDVIEESIELAMLQFLDQPISNALIASILASVNAFIRSLIQRGALVAGAASYNPAENPPAQIANGQLVFDIDVMPPPPAERITFNTYIDTTLLSQLTGNTSSLNANASATA